ncbi:MAG TPA: right-handed parallel beta-helix repeat-containing protein, partial [Candidatus Marinimicrobia bacterium]|nr:right-handed parallel beta-helix repeat-containing protein [Candidatus Neomarinimicrobiota bacterium]
MRIPVNLFRLGTAGIIMTFIMTLPMNLSATTKYYVDINRPDDSGDGTSWATAKKHLQSALHLVYGYGYGGGYGEGGDYGQNEIEIWVAAGTYNPSYETYEEYGDYYADRYATFEIPSGVAVYGGFTGAVDEVDLSQRDWANNVTILSGDIDGNDAEGDRSSNAYHVVSFHSVNENTVLDGFTITGGNADGDDEASNGGGIFNDFSNGGSPNIGNCIISGNSAANGGGGMYNKAYSEGDSFGSLTLTNCVISGNSAGSMGGGIYGHSKFTLSGGFVYSAFNLTLNNCTITGNSAVFGGGFYYSYEGNTVHPDIGLTTVINSIFWNNNSPEQAETWPDPSFLMNIDPDDAPTTDGDFHLIEGSPAIDSGTNDYSGRPDLDLDGNPRIQNDIIDMGAYEGGVPAPHYMVDADSPDGGNGEDWDHAFNKLQDALMMSGYRTLIWVAAGTYYPDEGEGEIDNDRLSTFNIPDGVKVYGGFDGMDGFGGGRRETELSDRDPEIYEVTLSGDIDGNDAEDDIAGNSYHVVTFENAQEETVLDGFSITGGNADGGGDLDNGGGIYNENLSSQITNCTISGNSAQVQGGGIFIHGGSILTNCTISNNSAGTHGGGMSITGSVVMTDCEVINNSTVGGATGKGGGIYNRGNGTFTRCIISGNLVSGEESKGGGIFNFKNSASFNYCTISGNVAAGASGKGGGIYNRAASPTLINITLTGNKAEYGGAMYGDESTNYGSMATIINSIFWNNGPIDRAYSNTNKLVFDPVTYYSDHYKHSNVEGSGGSGDLWNETVPVGIDDGNNIDSDPFFVEAVNILTVPT